ncbi:MAG: metallophosphoesterase family protein [Chloroflexota bacterium]|nr:metallophosphoesterase family protein [Chloroflexota bacterium]
MSRTLVLADIHANLTALDAVLAAAGQVDEVWNLGDTVGYGPHPVEVCERLAEIQPTVWLAGNHDLAATGDISLAVFNEAAATAARWNGSLLPPTWRERLRCLPTSTTAGDITLVHGSLRDPIWEYVLSVEAAVACLEASTTPSVLVGHSHVALTASLVTPRSVEFQAARAGMSVTLNEHRLLANPGSVGQPRDGDPRAAFALIERVDTTVTLSFGRVAYDIARTQAAMRRAGLPPMLIERLRHGR